MVLESKGYGVPPDLCSTQRRWPSDMSETTVTTL
jgi:hypothetical protein